MHHVLYVTCSCMAQAPTFHLGGKRYGEVKRPSRVYAVKPKARLIDFSIVQSPNRSDLFFVTVLTMLEDWYEESCKDAVVRRSKNTLKQTLCNHLKKAKLHREITFVARDILCTQDTAIIRLLSRETPVPSARSNILPGKNEGITPFAMQKKERFQKTIKQQMEQVPLL